MSNHYTNEQIKAVSDHIFSFVQHSNYYPNTIQLRDELVASLGLKYRNRYLSDADEELLDWLTAFPQHILTLHAWNAINESQAYVWPNVDNTENVNDVIQRNFDQADQFGFTHVNGEESDLVDYFEPQHRSPVAKTWLSGHTVFCDLDLNAKTKYLTGRINRHGHLIIFDIPQCDKDDLQKLSKYDWIAVTPSLVTSYVQQILRPRTMIKNKYLFDWTHDMERDQEAMQEVANQIDV